MKYKKFKIGLAIEAALCVFAALLWSGMGEAFASVMAFPFEQIGLGLRSLSLSGTAGNIAAIIIYGLICLSPAAYLCFRRAKKQQGREDILLILLSALLFFAVYLIINPVYFAKLFSVALGGMTSIYNAILGGVVYSVLAAYLVFRLLRQVTDSETGRILKCLKILMAAICVILVYMIFAGGLAQVISAIDNLKAGNSSTGDIFGGVVFGESVFISGVFIVLQQFLKLLPYLLEIIIIFVGFRLVDALDSDVYSDEVLLHAGALARVCTKSIVIIMVSQIALNLLQLFAGAALLSASYSLSLPLSAVTFVLMALLLAKYLEQGKKLKDDNDMFI